LQSKNLKDANANAHMARDNLKNLELRTEIVARVTQTTGDIKLSPFSQNKTGRAIGRWYCPYFRIDCSIFMPEASIQLVLTIDQSEGNFLPHTRYESIADTIV
jgi:hypothetical protein